MYPVQFATGFGPMECVSNNFITPRTEEPPAPFPRGPIGPIVTGRIVAPEALLPNLEVLITPLR